MTDDRALWARSLDGDTTAFGTLFERHADAVFGYCLRRTGAWSAAEDLVSVVFLEAWRRRHGLMTCQQSAGLVFMDAPRWLDDHKTRAWQGYSPPRAAGRSRPPPPATSPPSADT